MLRNICNVIFFIQANLLKLIENYKNCQDPKQFFNHLHCHHLNLCIKVFNNGRYEGEIKDGKRKGKGIFYFNNGNRYDGYWKDDKTYGQGVFYFNNGDRYDVN